MSLGEEDRDRIIEWLRSARTYPLSAYLDENDDWVSVVWSRSPANGLIMVSARDPMDSDYEVMDLARRFADDMYIGETFKASEREAFMEGITEDTSVDFENSREFMTAVERAAKKAGESNLMVDIQIEYSSGRVFVL